MFLWFIFSFKVVKSEEGKPKGYGFVNFKEPIAAEAVSELDFEFYY